MRKEDEKLDKSKFTTRISDSIDMRSSSLGKIAEEFKKELDMREKIDKIFRIKLGEETYKINKAVEDNNRMTRKVQDDFLNKLKNDLNNTLESRIKELDKKIKNIENELGNKMEEAKSYQLKIIETLGIFVALFTYISVEFQILRGINNLEQAVALSLILVGSLGMFLSLLSYCVGRFFYENSFRMVVFLISILILTIGVLMVAYPLNQDLRSKKMNFNLNSLENKK
ncbi:MAG: hypothetical protein RBS77_01710 [Candidatus Moranbacteria bacterium]|jgi:phage-related minor tail protein|nr:hypothetical protein [Candidatus Moranbacteria bacterium]